MIVRRVPVGIVGGGPAGLLLSHLLHLRGIASVVLELRSRAHAEQRVRAGVLEHGTVALLHEAGLGDRLRREGMVHTGFELRFDGEGHRIALDDLTGGRSITVYGQQEVVKDLIAARLAAGGEVHFEVPDAAVHGLDGDRPAITATVDGAATAFHCDFVAGCDGFHGVCRGTAPAGALRAWEREYPWGWVGILAATPPSSHELVYAAHERGFALHSMRSPALTRLYVQCGRDDTVGEWPDRRVWDELHARLARPGWSLAEGPVLEKGITGMRSFVVEPMRHGRLFLAGDAAHIVPPTGAKGLNLAVADVRVLAAALAEWYAAGSAAGLEAYSDTCLRRVWRAQAFSAWMTGLLHRPAGGDGFALRLQRARLRRVVESRAAAEELALNYVGAEAG
jgi:p-hydroxybenzoate 3-monooxygenase